MDSSLILSNILNPPVLFFFMGMIAVFLKSDLEIPQPLSKLFSLYLLFTVLCARASYIAVPAAMGMTVPEANPSLYISMALALTFAFNIIIGIPNLFGNY